MLVSQVIANSAPQQMLLPLAEAVAAPVPPNVGSTLLKNVAIFATIGAALGFGASFLGLPVIGSISAPIAAAIGGGIGAVLGLAKGLLSLRTQNTAYEAEIAAQLVQLKARVRAREKAHPTMILVVGKHPKSHAARHPKAHAARHPKAHAAKPSAPKPAHGHRKAASAKR